MRSPTTTAGPARRTALAGGLLLAGAVALAGAPGAQAKSAPAPVTGVVTLKPGKTLQVRAQPGRGAVVARVGNGTRLAIRCQADGPRVAGRFGRSKVWDQVRVKGRVGYVTDSYVFTGSDDLVAGVCGATQQDGGTKPGRVGTERLPLVVRGAPSTGGRVVTKLAPGAEVRISCQTAGDAVAGTYGTSTLWNRITYPVTGFVPDSYIYTGSDGRVAKDCGPKAPGGPALPPEDQDPGTGGGPQPGQAEEGTCTKDVPFALETAPANRAAFISAFAPDATASDRKTGVPASVTLGQGILESGDGRSTAGANNYFGIKAAKKGGGRYRWGDEAVGCVFRKTREVVDGKDVTVLAAFRLYRSAKDSFVDHAEFLSESSRYAGAFKAKNDSKEFIRRVHRAGYATDPNYSTLVIGLMDQNGLYRFDAR